MMLIFGHNFFFFQISFALMQQKQKIKADCILDQLMFYFLNLRNSSRYNRDSNTLRFYGNFNKLVSKSTNRPIKKDEIEDSPCLFKLIEKLGGASHDKMRQLWVDLCVERSFCLIPIAIGIWILCSDWQSINLQKIYK